MIKIKIIAIQKDNGDHYDPYESIQAFEYITENSEISSCTLKPMVDFIEKGGRAYVGSSLCVVRTSAFGNKYIKTLPDSNPNNNLLNLPEF